MANTNAWSLFLFKRGAVSQLTLVVHGRFLGDECHVGGGCTVNGAAENSVVGIGSTSERLLCTASEGVAALLTRPDADGLALDLRVLADWAGVLSGTLGHSRACISANGHTIACSESCCCACFLGSLCQSVPLLFCHEFSKFHASLLCHIKDLGKLGGSEHPF